MPIGIIPESRSASPERAREALSNLMEAISVCLEAIAEDAAAKAFPEIGPGRYNLSLSASEIQPAA